jgi:hypothetical protein
MLQTALDIRQSVFGGKNIHVATAHEDLAYSSYVHLYSSGKFDNALWVIVLSPLRRWLINDPSPPQLIPTIVTHSCHNASANVQYIRGVSRHNISNLIYVPLTAVMPVLILQLLHAVIMCLWTRFILLALSRWALGGSPLCEAHPALTQRTWAHLLLLSFPVKQ